ncbi:MAG: hypothetical protein OXG60_17265 [Chloroflexi bacterium]|nr:hypothetical protein [Chloroflexota bacterium]
MATQWTVEIDWERNGNYTGTYDNVTDRTILTQWFVGMRQPYQLTADNSVLRLVLRNNDRLFSAEYASSPLKDKLVPLRPVRIQSDDGIDSRTHFTGWVETIIPSVNHHGERIATVVATGAMQFLKTTETKIELQENQRSDDIIDALIQEVIFPPSLSDAWVLGDPGYSELGQTTFLTNLGTYSDFEEGVLTLHTVGDNWVRQGGYSDQAKDTFDVYRGIRDVTAAERGKFFFDREGKAVFWNRHHILDKDEIDTTLDDTMTDMKYTFASLDQTKNEIIVTCHPRTIAATATTLWELKDAVIRVAPGETREVYVKYKDEKDKRIGGKDVTAEDVECLHGHCSVEVEAKANGANLIFKNTSETAEAVVEKCVVKGRKVVDEGQMDARAIDQLSITYYGRRTMNINLPSIDDLDQAQYIADFERDRRKTPFGLAQTITLQSHAEFGGARHEDQLELTIGSLIRLQETQSDHEGIYFVIGEAHELARGGKHWTTTWYLEPQIETLPWRLEDSDRGKLDENAYLAY